MLSTKKKPSPFQYGGHHRTDHQYSDFHKQLDYALRHFYGKANLATVLMKKGLLGFNEIHLLDHATVDVWFSVVWVKVPKYYPSAHALIFHKSEKSFCRFISKNDFLQAVIEYAQLQGNQHTAQRCQHNPQKMWIKSSRTGEVHHLTPRSEQCECSCKAQFGLIKALLEDHKIQAFLVAHQIMRGQIPDKHIFSVWKALGASSFDQYQYRQTEWKLLQLGLRLQQDLPGHYIIYQQNRKLGTVDRKYRLDGSSYWIAQRQLTALRTVQIDNKEYYSYEQAAIALAEALKVISDGEKAKADFFGDYEPEPQHLLEDHGGFLDDSEDLRLAADFEAEAHDDFSEEQPPQPIVSRWLTAESFSK